jgi:hypothetical protein
MTVPTIDLKRGTVNGKKIEQSCENCTRLPVCWLVVSLKNAMAGHEQQTGVKMFDWKKLGLICDQYITVGPITITADL